MQGAGVTREFITFGTDDAVYRRRTVTAEEHRQKGAFFEARGQQLSKSPQARRSTNHARHSYICTSIQVMYPRRKNNCYVCLNLISHVRQLRRNFFNVYLNLPTVFSQARVTSSNRCAISTTALTTATQFAASLSLQTFAGLL